MNDEYLNINKFTCSFGSYHNQTNEQVNFETNQTNKWTMKRTKRTSELWNEPNEQVNYETNQTN